ncbi:MAG: F0F1 ATP synthase subunit delta [Pseudomonadota bacterium]
MANSSLTSGVASRYAGSLLELAEDSKSIDKVEADLNGLSDLIGESDDFRRLIESPAFSADAQFSAISTIADKAKLNPLTSNFLKVVAQNRRLFALPGIIKAFREAVAAKKGVVSAEVTSASALTGAQMKELQATLKSVAGKDVDITVSEDPSLIGGLIVKMGSRMIDTSLKTKLSSLKLALKEVS